MTFHKCEIYRGIWKGHIPYIPCGCGLKLRILKIDTIEIQVVEGKLTITPDKGSPLPVDLTEALKTGERIVVKLENGVLKLYDKYNKPIEEN